jgi:hypothetical protein
MFSRSAFAKVVGVAALAALIVGALPCAAWAQNNNNNNNNGNNINGNVISTSAVGGVLVDASGLLTNVSREEKGRLERLWTQARQPVQGPVNKFSPRRFVSLAGLNDELDKGLKAGRPITEEMTCLAGLQKIDYVLVYPDRKDIVLVGPAEGWRGDVSGCLVGATTGRAVMLLDDLLVALRAASATTKSTMSCSINPTPEGIKRLEALNRAARSSGMQPQPYAASMKEQLGPQTIAITGVPETSHFARVMVGADYRMKRISMNFEPSPVSGLRGYFEMITGVSSNALPRFWLQPEYAAIVRDEAGLAWEFRGSAVRAMAESDFIESTGQATPTGKADAVSQRWADMMTKRYEALSAAEPIFGKLRNCMDMALVGALVVRENLTAKVQNPLPMLTGDAIATVKLEAPKAVASEANLAKKGKKWIFAAGGVQMNPWSMLEKTETSVQLSGVRAQADASKATTWWWD